MPMHVLPSQPAATYAKGGDTRFLRKAMGGFATGVTIVTTMAGEEPVGVTANSFTSVSLDPALVLVCLGKSLGCIEAFSQSNQFAINVLKRDQTALSARFAKKGVDRFADTVWQFSEMQLPLIDQALVQIECDKYDQRDYGDHTIFVGEVLSARYESDPNPLLYFGGEYHQLHAQ